MDDGTTTRARLGRPPVAERRVVAEVALELFSRDGFDATTVEDIAAAAGISRRSFFRYFDSKNDVVWGDFDALLGEMDAWLAAVGDDLPMLEVIADAVIRFNQLPPEAVPAHRQRMALILQVPALQAHSTLRYAAWRDVVARFVAHRLEVSPSELVPQLVGHLTLGTAVAAYEQWLADPGADLAAVMAAAFAALDVHLDRIPG
jgi:mycofactocin system transcriptional regulator